MRHQVAGYKLGRSKDQRVALRRTLIRQFFLNERIETTKTKAQAIRGDAERMITIARNSVSGTDTDKVNARRLVASKLGNDPATVRKLFDEIAPRYEKRPGGYTRIFKLGPRLGDNAEIVRLELVEE